MDAQVTLSTLFRAISNAEIQDNLSDRLAELQQDLTEAFREFREANVTPSSTHQFESWIIFGWH